MYNRKLVLDLLIPLLSGRPENNYFANAKASNVNEGYGKQIAGYLVNFGGINRAQDDLLHFNLENAGMVQ